MEPIVTILGIGAVGGAIRSILGYEMQADEAENFNYMKFGKSVVRAAIGGAAIVMGATALTGDAITTQTYIMAFFTAIGSDVLVKEGTGATGLLKK